jgi:ribonuclease VapC
VIVDSSAIVAILLKQDGYGALAAELDSAFYTGVGVPTLVETGIVLSARLGVSGKTLLARFVEEAGLDVIAYTPKLWSEAVDAFLKYGKGRHPAALNFGDCLTYATCAVSDQPLLCVGNDFTRTDLQLVRRPSTVDGVL